MLRKKICSLLTSNFVQSTTKSASGVKILIDKKKKKSIPYTGFEHINIGMQFRRTNGRAIRTDYRARNKST